MIGALAFLAPLAWSETTGDPGHAHPPASVSPPATPPAPAPQAPAVGQPDKEAPGLEVRARRKQDVDRLLITVYIHEAGSIEVSASARAAGRASKAIALRSIKRSLRPHVPNRLRLKFSREQLCAVKRSLVNGGRMRTSVKVTARDKAGNARSASRRITLRRERRLGCRSASGDGTDALLRRTLRLLERLLKRQESPSKGATGVAGAPGAAGVTGPGGSEGRSALSALQPLETVRGTVGGQAADVPAFNSVGFSATLPVPAPVGLDDAHVVVDGSDESPTSETCQGTAAEPTAAPGYVCIYPYFRENVFAGFPDLSVPPATKLVNGPTGFVWGPNLDPEGSPGAQRYGFQIQWFTCDVGMTDVGCSGTPYSDTLTRQGTAFFANWAYTAPAGNEAPPSGGHGH